MTKIIDNKEFHLTQSKTFCMAPWIHLYSSPSGEAAPCCIAESCAHGGVGDTKTQSLMEVVNSPKMNQLRTDMLSGVKNKECTKCYQHEEQSLMSSRNMLNSRYKEYYEEGIDYTNIDGSLNDFKMRYFDIRFNNICNFKCRTCGSGFSTQWEQEDLKNNVWFAKTIPKNDNPDFLKEIFNQIDFMETAYFAGGEPLITEEHYILLEEMIRKGRTNIELRYNTNLSNLKFKNKDLLSLWKHFEKGVDIYASIDHYGERAEYIRHGTDWGVIENNFIQAQKTPYLRVHMNTVLSVFNVLTIHKFYEYLINKNLYTPHSNVFSLYKMSTPEFLTCHILPPKYKDIAVKNIEKLIEFLKNSKFKPPQIKQLMDSIPWINSIDTWDKNKSEFRTEVKRLDSIRGEDFSKTFPELAPLLLTDRTQFFPI
jgi:hypothetical protein